MEKGYYSTGAIIGSTGAIVAIHNKNGKGLLHNNLYCYPFLLLVAIHNKNGKGLLLQIQASSVSPLKGAVAIHNKNGKGLLHKNHIIPIDSINNVAIHNKNGKGLLRR